MEITETLILPKRLISKLFQRSNLPSGPIAFAHDQHFPSAQIHASAHLTIFTDPESYPLIPLNEEILQIPSVEILLDCTTSNHCYKQRFILPSPLRNKVSFVNLLVNFNLSPPYLSLCKGERQLSRNVHTTISGTASTSIKEVAQAIKMAHHSNCSYLSFRFFNEAPAWAYNPVASLQKHLKRKIRLTRFENFGYKQVTHLETTDYGVRIEVWQISQSQKWHEFQNRHWRATTFTRQEEQDPTLNVLPANICNAHCPYCISDILGRKSSHIPPMDYSTLKRASIFVKRRGGTLANISGGGEPTLSPDIAKITNTISQYFDEVVLHTNGSRLLKPFPPYRNLIEALAVAGLTKISLHRVAASDDENFSLMRLKQRYDINKVITWAHDNKIEVQLSCVLLNSHVGSTKSIKHFLEWAATIGADSVVFRELLDGFPNNTAQQPPIVYCNKERVPVSIIEVMSTQDSQLNLIHKKRWGKKGMEYIFRYTSLEGRGINVRILYGKWYQREQTNSQVSGFVFRHNGHQWGLYAGWVSKLDRILWTLDNVRRTPTLAG